MGLGKYEILGAALIMVQVGVVTVGGMVVGAITQADTVDTFTPNLEGYVPEGRARQSIEGGDDAVPGEHPGSSERHDEGERHHRGGHRGPTTHHDGEARREAPRREHAAPKGENYTSSDRGTAFHQGTEETDKSIRDAAKSHDLDVNTMRSIASIESGMNPSSNAHRRTQYKGLYQIGREEWQRFGANGNIYSAHDNAMAAARMFAANRNQFYQKFGRDPTDTELYLMHQQGLGFYTRGAMTNIQGNPYPGMRGPQTHESFEAGWGKEVAKRKAGFSRATAPIAGTSAPKPFDPGTMPL